MTRGTSDRLVYIIYNNNMEHFESSRISRHRYGLLAKVPLSELKCIRVCIKRKDITSSQPPGELKKDIEDPAAIVPLVHSRKDIRLPRFKSIFDRQDVAVNEASATPETRTESRSRSLSGERKEYSRQSRDRGCSRISVDSESYERGADRGRSPRNRDQRNRDSYDRRSLDRERSTRHRSTDRRSIDRGRSSRHKSSDRRSIDRERSPRYRSADRKTSPRRRSTDRSSPRRKSRDRRSLDRTSRRSPRRKSSDRDSPRPRSIDRNSAKSRTYRTPERRATPPRRNSTDRNIPSRRFRYNSTDRDRSRTRERSSSRPRRRNRSRSREKDRSAHVPRRSSSRGRRDYRDKKRERSITPLKPGEYVPNHPDLKKRKEQDELERKNFPQRRRDSHSPERRRRDEDRSRRSRSRTPQHSRRSSRSPGKKEKRYASRSGESSRPPEITSPSGSRDYERNRNRNMPNFVDPRIDYGYYEGMPGSEYWMHPGIMRPGYPMPQYFPPPFYPRGMPPGTPVMFPPRYPIIHPMIRQRFPIYNNRQKTKISEIETDASGNTNVTTAGNTEEDGNRNALQELENGEEVHNENNKMVEGGKSDDANSKN